MEKKTFKDSDILKAMAMHLDEDSVVFGDKDYNSQSNIDDASGTTAAELYRTDNDELPEGLQKAVWLKEY